MSNVLPQSEALESDDGFDEVTQALTTPKFRQNAYALYVRVFGRPSSQRNHGSPSAETSQTRSSRITASLSLMVSTFMSCRGLASSMLPCTAFSSPLELERGHLWRGLIVATMRLAEKLLNMHTAPSGLQQDQRT
jgi:hypothetical protein